MRLPVIHNIPIIFGKKVTFAINIYRRFYHFIFKFWYGFKYKSSRVNICLF